MGLWFSCKRYRKRKIHISLIMTIKEAIKEANSRPTNAGLNYYVSKWNNGYIIHPTSYMERHPSTIYVYSTLNKK